MTITPRFLHGACRVPSAPVLHMPSRRLSAVYGRAMAPSRPMAAFSQVARGLIPAVVIA
jgi:hypothetical protein